MRLVFEFLKEQDQNPQSCMCLQKAFPGVSDLALIDGDCRMS